VVSYAGNYFLFFPFSLLNHPPHHIFADMTPHLACSVGWWLMLIYFKRKILLTGRWLMVDVDFF
jgi:hypothetical protein